MDSISDPPDSQEKEIDLTQGGTYSNGTGALAIQLSAHIKAFDNVTDTILINLGTLLRNRLMKTGDVEEGSATYSKMIKESSKEMVIEVSKELQEFIKTIYQAYTQTKIEKPFLLLYCPAYEKVLPASVLRPATGQRLMLQEACASMVKEITGSGLNKNISIGDLSVRYLPITNQVSVSRTLIYLIRGLRNRQQVLMVSHQPVDWHICDVVKNMVLLESHTGKYKHPDQFGEKAFGVELPFLPSTHAVLGDKVLIKPVLTPKQKKELLELAESQQWDLRTSEFVSDSIRKKGWLEVKIESYFKAR